MIPTGLGEDMQQQQSMQPLEDVGRPPHVPFAGKGSLSLLLRARPEAFMQQPTLGQGLPLSCPGH